MQHILFFLFKTDTKIKYLNKSENLNSKFIYLSLNPRYRMRELVYVNNRTSSK
jgi:hypothetical protein